MSLSRYIQMGLAACVAIFASGCGDDPAGGGNPVDTTPPGVASVTALDRNHIQLAFSEAVQEQTAEVTEYYRVVERAPLEAAPAAPGDPLPLNAAVLNADRKTLVLTTGSPMLSVPYDFFVHGVEDLAGNKILNEVSSAFTGSIAPDVTPPVLLARSPVANATGVAIGQAVVLEFSESMDPASVLLAFRWTYSGGEVVSESHSQDNATFTFVPIAPLDQFTLYAVSLTAEARDWAGNALVGTTWSFQTTNQIDNTSPVMVSSNPAAGATGIALTSNLSMTFSEALQPDLDEVLVTPDIGDGVLVWSSDGRTFTFDPYADLQAGTQYSVFVPPGAAKDLAGNGTVDAIAVVFSTGPALANGSCAGTLAGDPSSATASNPAGALVVAADRTPFAEGALGIAGSAIAGGGGAYDVQRLPDGTYWTFAVKETNGDGRVNPETGDAFGIYGVDFAAQTGEADSVTITGGSDLTGIDFKLFDAVSLSGSVVYEGSRYPECCYTFFVGVFDTTGFDPGNPTASEPLYSTDGGIPTSPRWYINQFDQGLEPGTYYVGAYMDANHNSTLDADDPLALYESGGVPVRLTLEHGTDVLGITIHLQDPPIPGARALRPVAWPAAKTDAATPQQQAFRRLVAAFRHIPEARRSAFVR